MNKNQKIALLVTAVAIILIFVFPPFQIVLQGSTFNMGYGFIFSPPIWGDNENLKAFVNIGMLLIEWMGAVILGSIAFFLLKSKA